MQDMMANAAAWFDQVRCQHLSITVQYLRSGQQSPLSCKATVVDGKWETVDAAGQIVRMETRDFFINTTDLSADPQRGDKITISNGNVQEIYEVSVPAGAQQVWRWSDRRHAVRRIHTMQRDS